MTKAGDLATHLDTHSFARRLRQAVHDKSHEINPEVGLTHFWDASCLTVPIRGYRSLPASYPNVSSAQQLELLVGALYSSGQIGSVSMLPGHALELISEIRGSIDDKIDGRDLREFVKSHSSRLSALSELLESVPATKNPMDQGTVSEVLGQLRTLDPSVFVIVESLTNSSARRIRKWLTEGSGVRFIDYPAVQGFRIDQKPFAEFYDTLNRFRPNQRRSNAVDASVLRTLVELNSSGPPYPRFYTTTPTLTRMYSSSQWVRDYFSFFLPSDSGERTTHTIWRNAEYYYLRSLFPALRIGDEAQAIRSVDNDASASPTFSELKNLSAELDHALDAEKYHEFDRLVRGFTFESGQPLQDIVNSFSGIGMANAWVNLRLEDVAKELVEGAGQLSRLSEDVEFRNAVDDMWRGVEKATREVVEISRTVESVKMLSERLAKMRGRYPRPEDVPDASGAIADDLLAYRWAGPMNRRVEALLIAAMNGRPDYAQLMAEFAPSVLISDPRRAATAIAIMYGLELYTEAEALADRLRALKTTEIELLRLSAKLRRAQDAQEVRGIAQVLSNLWDESSHNERLRLCLGFGHAHLQVILKIGYMSRPSTDSSRRQQSQLSRIRRFIARSLADIHAQDIVWHAFCINFIVHAQTIDPIDEFAQGDQRHYLELAGLKSIVPRIDRQYRFEDTILYRDLQQAIVDLSASANSSGPCRRLRVTLAGFETLQERTRSRTVHAHVLEAEAAWRLYKCEDHNADE